MRGPAAPPPRHRTVNAALEAAAAGGATITIVDLAERETSFPFSEIYARARRAAAVLAARGVAAGDRIAIVLPTSPAFLDAYFGALLAGAVPVPLYPPLRLGRLPEYHAATAAMMAAVGARVVVADVRTRALLGRAVELARPPLGCLRAEQLAAGDPAPPAAVRPDDLALVQFSSGSTTDPKPVALTHANLMAQLAALAVLLPPEEGAPQMGVSWLPLYHDMGLIGCLLLAVYVPGPLVLIPPENFLARPALWLRAIARHRATVSVAPNFGYEVAARRVRDAELAGCDLACWRLAVCGAEPVSAAALERFARRFARFGFDRRALRPVYGLSEAALAVTFTPPGRGPTALGVDPVRLAAAGEAVAGERAIVSVGTPIPGAEVEVRGEDGRERPERRVGRIVVRGPSVMTGYFGRPDATAAALADGFLDTGDLGFVAGGELYVCGRAKDLIVIRGANHAPQEFEDCLAGVKGVRAGCAVALGFVPDGDGAEALLVLAERARDAAPDDGIAERIRSAVLEHTGIRPYTVRLLEPGTLPRTSSGKMRRGEALRRFLAGELTPPRAAGPARLATEAVRSALAFARARVGRGR
ncbi:MAG: fatty acyl-AMP ligase [Acidobacteria bacterium]|nr:MAG: fatty acyl-AMP ligase [Acidobacteriota bacterium]